MRRSVSFLISVIPSLVACEDGPNQTFQPATGILFNSGDTPAAVTDLRYDFGPATSLPAPGAPLQAVTFVDVRAPRALDSNAILYRLSYVDPRRVAA